MVGAGLLQGLIHKKSLNIVAPIEGFLLKLLVKNKHVYVELEVRVDLYILIVFNMVLKRVYGVTSVDVGVCVNDLDSLVFEIFRNLCLVLAE